MRILPLLAAAAACGTEPPPARLDLALAAPLAAEITFLQIAFVPNPSRAIPCARVTQSCLVEQMRNKTVEPAVLAGAFEGRRVARVAFAGGAAQTERLAVLPGRYLVLVEGVKAPPQGGQRGELVANGCVELAEVEEDGQSIAVTLAPAGDPACDALIP